MKALKIVGLAVAAVAVAGSTAHAALPDPAALVATATTIFEAVGVVVGSAVGFFIGVKIVKWIRK